MWNIPEGESDSDPRWQKGYEDGHQERKPESEDSVYISGWLHGFDGANQCGAAVAESAYLDSLYAGGL